MTSSDPHTFFTFAFLSGTLRNMKHPDEPPQKEVELRVIAAARKAGAAIPTGEIVGEEPDFRFETESGELGIELSELLPPASTDGGITPIEQAAFYGDVIRIAQERFCKEIGVPVQVGVTFGDGDAGRTRRNKHKMARALIRCVQISLPRATDFVALYGSEVPEGFGSVTITSGAGDWHCSQGSGITLDHIPVQIASRIRAKNALVPKYRANLRKGAAIWLLLYSRPNVSRSVPIPYGIEQWKFLFEFDRVLWFAILENQIVEIQRAESAKEAVA
jgi:hypothetical protein